jgi:hypothetical protein
MYQHMDDQTVGYEHSMSMMQLSLRLASSLLKLSATAAAEF